MWNASSNNESMPNVVMNKNLFGNMNHLGFDATMAPSPYLQPFHLPMDPMLQPMFTTFPTPYSAIHTPAMMSSMALQHQQQSLQQQQLQQQLLLQQQQQQQQLPQSSSSSAQGVSTDPVHLRHGGEKGNRVAKRGRR
jgi:hypothetical protein